MLALDFVSKNRHPQPPIIRYNGNVSDTDDMDLAAKVARGDTFYAYIGRPSCGDCNAFEPMLKRAKRLVPDLNTEGAENWMGFRPSIPDSKPVISPAPGSRNIYFAFGHGHFGLTLAAVTAKAVADMVAGRPTEFDITPFRADRF